MIWIVEYHRDVETDLKALGPASAIRALKAIDQRIRLGIPDRIGKPLRGELIGCRRLRVGAIRIVYRVNSGSGRVLELAIGPRRDDKVYRLATGRAK
jgi:mRNA interferase RelE/StbE